MRRHLADTFRMERRGRNDGTYVRSVSARTTGTTMCVCLVVVALLASSCVKPRPHLPPVMPVPTTGAPSVHVADPDGAIQRIPLEEYVRGSLLAEANLSNLDRAAASRVARVQAILARTYALANRGRHASEGFDLCSTTHCQVYRPVAHMPVGLVRLADEATAATTGLVVTYDEQPINAVFHANCGGHTSDAQVVWQGPTPTFLQGVSDLFCLWEAPAVWQFETTESALRRALNREPNTAVGSALDALEITARDDAGRVARVILHGDRRTVVRGEQLRAVLMERYGPRSIRSTKFSVRKVGDHFVFEGRGLGHGVGLCQAGAAARARAGHSPPAILQHYYPGTSLRRYPTDS